jgi:multidrug efflux system membrane fusion protein
MKINRSIIIAVLAVLFIAGWFRINTDNESTKPSAQQSNETTETKLPSVVTRTIQSELHAGTVKLFGRSEAAREVTLKAETAGPVVSTPIAEGSRVKRGTIVCRQDVNARQAMVDQAKALLRTRELEYQAASKLVERGFASETQALTAQAGLDAAKASVKQAEIELGNINIRAPFSGIYDKNIAEIGDYLAPGQPCGLLIELDPLIVTIDLTDTQLSLVSIGQEAVIGLATGESVTGIVKFIESRANPATRTFKTEIAVPNKDLSLKAGVTATVKLSNKPAGAHLVPGQIFALNDDGIVGVKYLDDNDIVQFVATETVDETIDGVWVKGLPETVRIILKGQDFVASGVKAVATDESAQ